MNMVLVDTIKFEFEGDRSVGIRDFEFSVSGIGTYVPENEVDAFIRPMINFFSEFLDGQVNVLEILPTHK